MMAGILPHSTVIRGQIDSYLGQAAHLTKASADALRSNGDFTAVYKIALATDSVLSKLASNERPKLTAARTVVRRVPFLAIVGQTDAAMVDLRRLIELCFWCVYFSEHPVEWRSFAESPGRGIEAEKTEPISLAAHREPSHYANYARERFHGEPSGLAVEATDSLRAHYGTLSGSVHASSLTSGKLLLPPIRVPPKQDLPRLMSTFKSVAGSVCLVLAAFHRKRFERLPPMHREWFDWLIGDQLKRRLRSGQFGLPD
jgi:hypothetical protein